MSRSPRMTVGLSRLHLLVSLLVVVVILLAGYAKGAGSSLPTSRVTLAAGDFNIFMTHDSPTTQVIGNSYRIIRWAPDGLYSGRRTYGVFGFRLVTGVPGRFYDWHTDPGDVGGWYPPCSYGVAPLAIDYTGPRGVEAVVEPEDSGCSGGSGNYHLQILSQSEAEARRGQWIWLWAEITWGRRDTPTKGALKIWVAGEATPRVDVSGINTHWAGEQMVSYWEGAYHSCKCSGTNVVEIAATRFGRTPQEAYEDTPVFHTAFPDQAPNSSIVQIDPRNSTEAPVPPSLDWGGAPPPPPPPPPPVNTALPAITGSAQQGSTLSASTGSWSGSPTGFAYQWKRCDTAGANCASVGGGTGQQYALGVGDVGKRMRVTVTATNPSGSAEATSNPTGVVAAAPPPPPPPPPASLPPVNTALPAITGTPQQGKTLTSSTGSWSNLPTGYAYQWRRCDTVGANCVSVAGATASSYTPVGGDVASRLRVTVTASNAAGSAAATSDATDMIAPAPAPQAPKVSTRPTVSGSPDQGATLTSTTGSWTNSPKWYAFQWRRCNHAGGGCVNIDGATSSKYKVSAADGDRTLRVVVAAANDTGVSYARTDETALVPPASQSAPELMSRPTIVGNPQQGNLLRVVPGEWANEPTSYGYQWRRCNADGLECVSIDGAVEELRVVSSRDVGWTLRVVVTATNAAGSSFARTEATALVIPRPVAPPGTDPDE